MFQLHFIFDTDQYVEVVHNGNIVLATYCHDSVIDPGFCYIRMLDQRHDNMMGKFHMTCIHPAPEVASDHPVAVSAIPPSVPEETSGRTRRRPSYFAESVHSTNTRTAPSRSRGRNVRQRVDSEGVSDTSSSEDISDTADSEVSHIDVPDVEEEEEVHEEEGGERSFFSVSDTDVEDELSEVHEEEDDVPDMDVEDELSEVHEEEDDVPDTDVEDELSEVHEEEYDVPDADVEDELSEVHEEDDDSVVVVNVVEAELGEVDGQEDLHHDAYPDVNLMDHDQLVARFGDGTENYTRLGRFEFELLPWVVGTFKCPLCLDDMEDHHTKDLARCGHLICFPCTEKFIESFNCCPICRETHFPENLHVI